MFPPFPSPVNKYVEPLLMILVDFVDKINQAKRLVHVIYLLHVLLFGWVLSNASSHSTLSLSTLCWTRLLITYVIGRLHFIRRFSFIIYMS